MRVNSQRANEDGLSEWYEATFHYLPVCQSLYYCAPSCETYSEVFAIERHEDVQT